MKTNLKPFDLEKALAGEPVALRNGAKAYVRHRETRLKTDYPLIGYVVQGGTVDTMLWTECGHEHAYKVKSGYDIVGMWSEPLVFEHWNLITEDINYLAKDSNGRWFGYEREPTQSPHGDWSALGGFIGTGVLNPKLFPECNWKTSLMERPEND